jgi:hypothetical protein
MGTSVRTDVELLAATAAEPEAFGEFYRRHERQLLVFLWPSGLLSGGCC